MGVDIPLSATYIESQGGFCPWCAHTDIVGCSIPKFRENIIVVTNRCRKCHFEWNDIFALDRLEIMEKPKPIKLNIEETPE